MILECEQGYQLVKEYNNYKVIDTIINKIYYSGNNYIDALKVYNKLVNEMNMI